MNESIDLGEYLRMLEEDPDVTVEEIEQARALFAEQLPEPTVDMDYYPPSTLSDRQKDSLMHLQETFYRQVMFRAPEHPIKGKAEHVLYVKQGERILGALWYEAQEDLIYISQIFVDEDAKEKGFARGMINKLIHDHEQQIKDGTIQSVYADSTEEAMPFYEHLGFVKSGRPTLCSIDQATIIGDDDDTSVDMFDQIKDLVDNYQADSGPKIITEHGVHVLLENQHMVLPFTKAACKDYCLEVPETISFDEQMTLLRQN